MRTLPIVGFVTLDGVMRGLGGPDEDRRAGFHYGGWGAPHSDGMIGQSAASFVSVLGPNSTSPGRSTWLRELGVGAGAEKTSAPERHDSTE
jgi:hypothetical protein